MKVKLNIGTIISEARKSKQMTQQDLAKKVFVTDKAVSNWENGKNVPDEEIIKKLENILDVELLERKETKKSKIFFIILAILIFFLLITLSLLIYFINNFNRFNIYDITIADSNYKINDGQLIITPEEIIIKTAIIENVQLPLQPQYNVELYYKDETNSKTLIANKKTYDYFSIRLNTSKENKKSILNNLYIKINYIDYDEKEISNELKIKLSLRKSNNKLFYNKNKTNSKKNYNNINLLINNNYSKVDDITYEKQINNDYYKYNIETKDFYYEGKKDNLIYYAIKRENEQFHYVIIQKDVIIEYKLSNSIKGNKYIDIINEKMNELNKLEIH